MEPTPLVEAGQSQQMEGWKKISDDALLASS